MTTERLTARELLIELNLTYQSEGALWLQDEILMREGINKITDAMEVFARQEVEAEIEKRMPTEKEAREQAELKYADPYHRAWWVGGALWAIGLFRSCMKGENKTSPPIIECPKEDCDGHMEPCSLNYACPKCNTMLNNMDIPE